MIRDHGKRTLLIGLLAIGASACSGDVIVTEVLNHHTCRLSGPGVKQVEHDALPQVRGARLLTEPGQETLDLEGDKPRVLAAVSMGSQATGGYALTLDEAVRTGDVITLNYTWTIPAPDSVRTQMVTHPCSVIEFEAAAGSDLRRMTIEAVTTIDRERKVIGSIELATDA